MPDIETIEVMAEQANHAPKLFGVDKVSEVNLDTEFDYTHYTHLFPEDRSAELIKMFAEKEYGWKSRAKMVLRLAQIEQYMNACVVELSESFIPVERQKRTPEDQAAIGLRNYLLSILTPDGANTDKFAQLQLRHGVHFVYTTLQSTEGAMYVQSELDIKATVTALVAVLMSDVV